MYARTLGTVVLTTILALTIGVAAFVSSASAANFEFPNVADLDAGDLIKTQSSSTVYYFGIDNKRYTFPNNGTFMSWYDDFDDVKTVTSAELANIPFGGIVTYKPFELLKIQSDSTVYYVTEGGELVAIESEQAAKDNFGSDWADEVDDIPDSFWGLYTVSDDMLEEGVALVWEELTDYTISDDKDLDEVVGVFMYSDPLRFTASDESVDCGESYCAYNEATMTSGGTLKFVNYTGETLTVTEEDGLWSTGEMEDGDIVVLTIDDKKGTYGFSAEEDEDMVGTLYIE